MTQGILEEILGTDTEFRPDLLQLPIDFTSNSVSVPRILMLSVLEFIATLSCALFAGAAVYINVVEHPARMQCGTEIAATVFGPSYRRATVMQASLALVATLSALGAAWLADSALWLVGALLIFSVVPFTLLVILPTNKQLLARGLDRAAPSTQQLLVRWGRLHSVRSAASVAADILFLIAVMRTHL
jgi:uncharacterized membrane protein